MGLTLPYRAGTSRIDELETEIIGCSRLRPRDGRIHWTTSTTVDLQVKTVPITPPSSKSRNREIGAGEGRAPGHRFSDCRVGRITLEPIVRRLSPQHVTVGIILLVWEFSRSDQARGAGLRLVSVSSLLTWHARMRGPTRRLLYSSRCSRSHWFNSINEFLFHENAVTGNDSFPDSASPLRTGVWLVFALGCRWRPDLRNPHRAATAMASSHGRAIGQPG